MQCKHNIPHKHCLKYHNRAITGPALVCCYQQQPTTGPILALQEIYRVAGRVYPDHSWINPYFPPEAPIFFSQKEDGFFLLTSARKILRAYKPINTQSTQAIPDVIFWYTCVFCMIMLFYYFMLSLIICSMIIFFVTKNTLTMSSVLVINYSGLDIARFIYWPRGGSCLLSYWPFQKIY